jgi:hypothetical protein
MQIHADLTFLCQLSCEYIHFMITHYGQIQLYLFKTLRYDKNFKRECYFLSDSLEYCIIQFAGLPFKLSFVIFQVNAIFLCRLFAT